MNGFVNTMLSLMLSWIRALIANIWTMLNSEDGGALYRFLSAHWLVIVIILCAVCTAADLIVYFFRWRPDYVWASKWRRLHRRRSRSSAAASDAGQTPPQEAFSAYSAPAEPQPAAPTMSYAPLQPATMVYAPVSQPTQAWQPVQAQEEPVFDDAALWEDDSWEEEAPVSPAPHSETAAYFRDVQAGFAPAIPPEQLYAPSASYQPPVQTYDDTPVHPGLDEETFRQSVGLAETPAAPVPVMRAPVFRPFTVTHEPQTPVQQSKLQRITQRARNFMAMDESERRTIRDLQSSVDVSKAFHEPVYPQSYDRNKE